jgi:hypothetical protein
VWELAAAITAASRETCEREAPTALAAVPNAGTDSTNARDTRTTTTSVGGRRRPAPKAPLLRQGRGSEEYRGEGWGEASREYT